MDENIQKRAFVVVSNYCMNVFKNVGRRSIFHCHVYLVATLMSDFEGCRCIVDAAQIKV